MKKFLFLSTFLLVVMLLNAQTTIPNAGFESWTATGSYENPDSWDSPNDVTSSLGKIVVEKESSIVHSGSYSAMITALTSLAGTLPGVLTLADFSFDLLTFSATIEGGIPFTGRPEKFTGWFQYEPQNNDICLIGAFLLKENGGNWDTIAIAGLDTTATIVAWTQFNAVFDYRNSDIPTHLNIVLLPADRDNPQPNSTLYIDELMMVYPTSISDIDEPWFTVSKNYDTQSIQISNQNQLGGYIHIYNATGQLIKSESIEGENNFVSMSSLPSGIYLIQGLSEQGNYTYKLLW